MMMHDPIAHLKQLRAELIENMCHPTSLVRIRDNPRSGPAPHSLDTAVGYAVVELEGIIEQLEETRWGRNYQLVKKALR